MLPQQANGYQECASAGTAATSAATMSNASRTLGGEQWPDRHVSEPRGICTQLGGGCGDFIGVIDNRVGGGRAVIEIPKFELASDRLDKLGDTCLEGRGRLLF